MILLPYARFHSRCNPSMRLCCCSPFYNSTVFKKEEINNLTSFATEHTVQKSFWQLSAEKVLCLKFAKIKVAKKCQHSRAFRFEFWGSLFLTKSQCEMWIPVSKLKCLFQNWNIRKLGNSANLLNVCRYSVLCLMIPSMPEQWREKNHLIFLHIEIPVGKIP